MCDRQNSLNPFYLNKLYRGHPIRSLHKTLRMKHGPNLLFTTKGHFPYADYYFRSLC